MGSKLLTVISPASSLYRVECKATIARKPTPTLKVVTSALDKPLKSSLKCCSSQAPAPTVSSVGGRNSTTRSRKSVRFKEIDDQLESVCVFRATGRPSAIFGPISDSDTESETSSSDDDDDNAPASSLAQPPRVSVAAMLVPLDAADIVSPIPSPHTPLTCRTHVRLEFLSPVPASLGQNQNQGHGQPLLLLHGIVRVRNIAYEKCVAVRYTHDNWDTAIEVLARHTRPSPPAAPAAIAASDSGDGDGDGDGTRDGPWDWFTFTISLGLRAPRASLPRTLLLAVRFTVAGAGEWWDNNGGEDFRIVLAPSSAGRLGRGGTAGGGCGKGSGLRVGSEFARQPLAVPCSSGDVHAQTEMAWPAAPAPTAVMNRWIYVACL